MCTACHHAQQHMQRHVSESRIGLRQGLAKLLADHAPGCSKPQKFEDYFGRKIAIDASMHIYQFLVGGWCLAHGPFRCACPVHAILHHAKAAASAKE